MQIVIVGGGIAGLWLALRLLKEDDRNHITLLEANSKVGGRIRTSYDAAGNPILEEGAWRIPSSHRRMMSLCKELNLELRQVKSENGSLAETRWFDCTQAVSRNTKEECNVNEELRYGISMWDTLASQRGVVRAQECVARTGYAGADAMAAGTNAYDVEAIFEQNRAGHDATYWVPKRGLSSICDALISRIQAHTGRVNISLNTRVNRLQALKFSNGKRFEVTAVVRHGHNSHHEKRHQCHVVVLAIPPEQAKNISGVQSLSPVLETLAGVSLFKAFCASDDKLRTALGLKSQCFHLKANNLCQQIISSSYPGSDIIQIAYSSGQRADSLEHFRQCGKARRTISEDVARIAHGNAGASSNIKDLLLQRRMKFYYWKNAVHIWLPTVPSFNVSAKSVEACVLPSALLPGIFLCGEAYSTLQGWSEGALETCEHVLNVIKSPHVSSAGNLNLARLIVSVSNLNVTFTPHIPRNCVVFYSRIVDVTEWKKVHPGGEAAIENHRGENVSFLFDGALHPKYAQGILFALQIGWLFSGT